MMKLQKQKTKLLTSLILAILFSITCSSPATTGDGGDGNPTPNPCLADPPPETCVVTYTDWIGSFGQTPPPATPDASLTSQFLAGTATTLTPSLQSTTPTTLFMTGSTDNGVGFFRENNLYYYAGLLLNTNVGRQITKTITNERWTGKIRAVGSSNDVILIEDEIEDFGLDITFNGTTGTMKTIFEAVESLYYSMDGTFDDKGIISGLVGFGFTKGEGVSRIVNPDHLNYSSGTLSGIIGQNGAVVGFISGHKTIASGINALATYAGGFVVTPPSE